jgi:hypothetical protein
MKDYKLKTALEYANSADAAKYRRAIDILEAMSGEYIPDDLELEGSEGLVSEHFMNNFGELR